MTGGEDPLAALVARSVGGDVRDVRSEELAVEDGIERRRLHFTRDGHATTALFERSERGALVEAQLLPFLARKTGHVPRVHSRGIPPAHVVLGAWLLLEDLGEAESACDGDVLEVVRAKVAIERAVAADAPALKALGVKAMTPIDLVERAVDRAVTDRPVDADARAAAEMLSSLPLVLCHGELACTHARLTARGVVLLEWRRAYLGCGLLDIAQLTEDARRFTGEDPGDRLFGYYGELTGITVAKEMARASRLVDKVARTVSK